MKRAVIIARVSTDEQAEKGYSLPSQIEACRKYAGMHGFHVVGEFTDDISGVTPIAERPGGRQVQMMVDTKQTDAVIIHQIDRLSRDIVDLLATVRNWLRAGVEVHVGDVGKIESELDITLLIKGWQGADERSKIRERSMRGKQAKARAGRVVGGRPPYGYKHVRDANGKVVTFEPVEDEAKVVRLIYQWYVFGDETGNPLAAAAIAKRLSEMRIPTPGETRGYSRKRETGMWQPSKIVAIITHEVYAGVWRFAVRIGSTRNIRPPEEQIAVNVPAIIGRDLWGMAQERRERNKRMAKRNRKRDYLLSGLIKCGCGRALCGESFGNHQYYTCTWYSSHHRSIEKRTCWARSVRADAIEADVWESIVGIFADAAQFEQLLRIAQQEESEALNPKREELAAVDAMLADAEHEAIEIGQALKRAAGIVGKALEQDMQDVNRRYDALCRRREELVAELDTVRLTETAIQDAIRFAEDVWVGIENADYATKRYNLETLKVIVTVQDGHYHVGSLAGEWDGEIRKLPIASRQSKAAESESTSGDKVGIANDWR